jgi:hypothetical protein
MIQDALHTQAAALARMGRGVTRPVPVRIHHWPAGRWTTIEAVNEAAAKELVEQINRTHYDTGRWAVYETAAEAELTQAEEGELGHLWHHQQVA